MGTRKKHTLYPLSERRESYLQVFFIAFGIMLLIMLPVMILTKGYFIYYGDFNSQQLPFYYLAHKSVVNGDFGWNWQTDLGANFIGSYSFYLLGSPFFWLTVPFPQGAVLYLMPYLLALKHAFAALTAYAYIRRFVRSRHAALIGGLLYAFSGFQLYNIFFNHFQDVTAFFPLMLIAMEQRVNENRRGVFALSVAFMAILNYYFFTGQAVFLVLYFIVRCPCKDFDASMRKFLSIALEAVIGVLIAAFMLLPSALAIYENYRVKKYLWGMDMVAYYDRTRLWRIIQSFFMLPDVPARPNLFQSDYGKWSSMAGYLPLYSMAGVIAFLSQKRKHWASRLTVICIICAFVPVLNSMFYMFNASYYARWYYMPLLIMAMMTAYALDNPKIRWRGGMTVCGIFLAAFGIISLLPTRDKKEKIHFFEFAKYNWYFWLTLGFCAIMLYFAALILIARKKGRKFYKIAVFATAFCCLCSGCGVVYFGLGLGAWPESYINTAINGGEKISLPDEPHQFYRVDISKDYDNYPMFWGYSNMRCFHSIVPVSTMDFYDAVDITRDVASRAEPKNYALRELFSVKYYFDKVVSGEDGNSGEAPERLEEMPSFRYLKRENGFNIYENEAYIPMGIAYDSYIPETALNAASSMTRQKLMLSALGMNEKQIEKYRDILTELPAADRVARTDLAFAAYCSERAEQTCSVFNYGSDGFQAQITLEKPEMVFFSVPYESGWEARVNGRPVGIERVNYGFMAVRCEAGVNNIEFFYETPGLRNGAILSIAGIGLLLLYLIWAAVAERGKRSETAVHPHCYDYEPYTGIPEHTLYLRYAAAKHPEPAPYAPPLPDDEPDPAPDDTADLSPAEQDDLNAPEKPESPEEPEMLPDAQDAEDTPDASVPETGSHFAEPAQGSHFAEPQADKKEDPDDKA